MDRRFQVRPSGSAMPTMLQSGQRNYGLPANDDKQGWRALLLPFAGRLKLVGCPAGRNKFVKVFRRVRHGRAAPLESVDVWLHSGLYFRQAGRGEAEPLPGQVLPTAEGAGRGWHYCPLPRDKPDGMVSFDVLVEPYVSGQASTGAWYVIRVRSLQEQPPVTLVAFVAPTKLLADEWKRQMVLRATPLSLLWQRLQSIGGVDAGSAAGPSARPRVGGVRALVDSVDAVFASSVTTAAAGVTTAVLCGEIFDVVTSAGPCFAFVIGAMAMAVRVCTATAAMGGVTEDLRGEIGRLHNTLRSDLLPAIMLLRKAESAKVETLLTEVGMVADRLDAITGKLFHLALSLGARLREAVSTRGRDEDLAVVEEVRACKEAVRDLMMKVGHSGVFATLDLSVAAKDQAEAAADEERAQALEDARKFVAVPPPSGPVVARWGAAHADKPWCQLLEVVLREPTRLVSGTCACIISMHGMGGVGKSTASQLVATRVAAEGKRFSDGVFWMKIGRGTSQEASYERVTKNMTAVATCLLRRKVTALSIESIADQLREALAGKSVLLIVDDCWDDGLARSFVRTVGDERCCRCCLLFTTRSDDVARHATSDCVVRVGTVQSQCAEEMLLAYALRDGSRQGPCGDHEKRALAELVKAAAGLPLALAVLGSLVCARGWVIATKDLEKALPFEKTDEGVSLWACFMASYRQLCVDGAEDDVHAGDDMLADLYKALCVIGKQEWLPLSAVSTLWGMDVKDARRHLRIVARYSLATVREEAGTVVVGLHDLIVDWICSRLVPRSEERQRYHAALVNGYGSHLGDAQLPIVGEGRIICSRPWWDLPGDGYVEHALCRHLHAGGPRLHEELLCLLCDLRWITLRVTQSGNTAVGFRADCRMSGVALLMRVATVVEGALVAAAALGYSATQGVAYDLAMRLQAVTPADVSGIAHGHVQQLMGAARAFLDPPVFELLRPRTLRLPQEVTILSGHDSSVTCSCSLRSTEGTTILVTGSLDSTVRVWDVERGECVRVLEGHALGVECLCVVEVGGDEGGSAGGAVVQRVVSGSWDKTVRVWDVERGECMRVLEGHAAGVNCLCVVEVGRDEGGGAGGAVVQRVVSGSSDSTVRVWDVERGECVRVLEGHAAEVNFLCGLRLSSSPRRLHPVQGVAGRLFVVCDGGSVLLVDLASRERVLPVVCSLRVSALVLTPRVFLGCQDGGVHLAGFQDQQTHALVGSS